MEKFVIKWTIIVYVVIYLLASFMTLSFNPSTWKLFERSAGAEIYRIMIGILMVFTPLYVIMAYKIKQN